MAKYKFVDMTPRLLPLDLEAQLVAGSFAHALHHVIDTLDLCEFDSHKGDRLVPTLCRRW